MLATQYDASVVGVEYIEQNTELAKNISGLCDLPIEFVSGDALAGLPDYTQMDACISTSVIESIPYEQH